MKPTSKPYQGTKTGRPHHRRENNRPANRLLRRKPNQYEGIYGEDPLTVTMTLDPNTYAQTDPAYVNI